MSSIIRNRNGVIEVSLGSSKPAHWRRPLQGYPQLRRQRGECTPLRRSRSVQRPLSYTLVCVESGGETDMVGALDLTEPKHLLAKLERECESVLVDRGDSYAAINALRDAFHLRGWIW